MPTFLFLKNGSVVDTCKGANSSQLTSMVAKHSSGGASSGFSGTGNTLSGSRAGASTPAAAGGGIGNMVNDLKLENVLPLVVLIGYVAYVIFS